MKTFANIQLINLVGVDCGTPSGSFAQKEINGLNEGNYHAKPKGNCRSRA